MAEAQLVDEHPAGCTVCMAVAGPFVVYKLAGWTVQTVNGPLVVDTEIVLCGRNDRREGCIGQAARIAGYIGPDEAENPQRQHAETLDRYALLEQAHAELEQKQALDRKQLAVELAEEIIARAG